MEKMVYIHISKSPGFHILINVYTSAEYLLFVSLYDGLVFYGQTIKDQQDQITAFQILVKNQWWKAHRQVI